MSVRRYMGTIWVNAGPMTRADYNTYRGWELPEDENGEDEGYLVAHVECRRTQHADRKGHITWLPKDVFRQMYHRADTWQDRLVIEQEELAGRIAALESLIESVSTPSDVAPGLFKQLQYMRKYNEVLLQRLACIH